MVFDPRRFHSPKCFNHLTVSEIKFIQQPIQQFTNGGLKGVEVDDTLADCSDLQPCYWICKGILLCTHSFMTEHLTSIPFGDVINIRLLPC